MENFSQPIVGHFEDGPDGEQVFVTAQDQSEMEGFSVAGHCALMEVSMQAPGTNRDAQADPDDQSEANAQPQLSLNNLLNLGHIARGVRRWGTEVFDTTVDVNPLLPTRGTITNLEYKKRSRRTKQAKASRRRNRVA